MEWDDVEDIQDDILHNKTHQEREEWDELDEVLRPLFLTDAVEGLPEGEIPWQYGNEEDDIAEMVGEKLSGVMMGPIHHIPMLTQDMHTISSVTPRSGNLLVYRDIHAGDVIEEKPQEDIFDLWWKNLTPERGEIKAPPPHSQNPGGVKLPGEWKGFQQRKPKVGGNASLPTNVVDLDPERTKRDKEYAEKKLDYDRKLSAYQKWEHEQRKRHNSDDPFGEETMKWLGPKEMWDPWTDAQKQYEKDLKYWQETYGNNPPPRKGEMPAGWELKPEPPPPLPDGWPFLPESPYQKMKPDPKTYNQYWNKLLPDWKQSDEAYLREKEIKRYERELASKNRDKSGIWSQGVTIGILRWLKNYILDTFVKPLTRDRGQNGVLKGNKANYHVNYDVFGGYIEPYKSPTQEGRLKEDNEASFNAFNAAATWVSYTPKGMQMFKSLQNTITAFVQFVKRLWKGVPATAQLRQQAAKWLEQINQLRLKYGQKVDQLLAQQLEVPQHPRPPTTGEPPAKRQRVDFGEGIFPSSKKEYDSFQPAGFRKTPAQIQKLKRELEFAKFQRAKQKQELELEWKKYRELQQLKDLESNWVHTQDDWVERELFEWNGELAWKPQHQKLEQDLSLAERFSLMHQKLQKSNFSELTAREKNYLSQVENPQFIAQEREDELLRTLASPQSRYARMKEIFKTWDQRGEEMLLQNPEMQQYLNSEYEKILQDPVALEKARINHQKMMDTGLVQPSATRYAKMIAYQEKLDATKWNPTITREPLESPLDEPILGKTPDMWEEAAASFKRMGQDPFDVRVAKRMLTQRSNLRPDQIEEYTARSEGGFTYARYVTQSEIERIARKLKRPVTWVIELLQDWNYAISMGGLLY